MEEKFTAPSFVGFDDNSLATDLEDFVALFVGRYAPDIVTHVFIGNETDQFLRLFPQNQDGFSSLMIRLKSKAETISNREKLGTIFTFKPDSISPAYNDLARGVAPNVEVMAFTVYPFFLFADREEKIDPTTGLISDWFDVAADLGAGSAIVVAETGHPALV